MIRPPETLVLLDANVFVTPVRRDFLFRLRGSDLPFRFVWSERIAREALRNIGKPFRGDIEKTRAHVVALKLVFDRFPEGFVSDWESLEASCGNDLGDRHVLAAARAARASTIVTENLRHFLPEHLEPWGIRAVDPDRFAIEWLEESPEVVLESLRAFSRDRGLDPSDALRRIAVKMPAFAARAWPWLQ